MMDVGPTFDLAFSPDFAHDRLCFAATADGLLVSRDGGRTWSVHPLFKGQVVTCLAISPSFAQDRRLLVGLPGGILLSTDAGESWTTSEFALSGSPRLSVLIPSPSFPRDGVALAGTMEDGIYRTTDRGRRWHPWNFGLLDLSVMALGLSPAFEQDETAFAGTTTGLFRSKNGGRAWREVDMGDEVAVMSLEVSPSFAHDGSVFVGTEEAGLFHSSDRGTTWQRLAASQIEGPVNALVILPHWGTNGALLAGLDTGLYESRDAGQSWALAGDLPLILCLASAPDFAESGSLLAGTAEAGIWYYVPDRQGWEEAVIGG